MDWIRITFYRHLWLIYAKIKMFWIFQCSKCGMWSVKETADINKATFKCRYCNTNHKIKKKNLFGLALNHHGPYNLGREAGENCRKLNQGGK